MNEQLDLGQKASGIANRVKAILMEPQAEWPRIAAEQASVRSVLLGYVLPLAAIGPIASFIGGQLFGYGGLGMRLPIAASLGILVKSYILSLVGLFVLSAITNALAPRFGGASDQTQAFRLIAYCATAGWVSGIFGVVPPLAFLGILGLYSIYLFHVGAPTMMRVPQDKATGFTAITFGAALLVSIVIGIAAKSLLI
jgi:hypothetical protein